MEEKGNHCFVVNGQVLRGRATFATDVSFPPKKNKEISFFPVYFFTAGCGKIRPVKHFFPAAARKKKRRR